MEKYLLFNPTSFGNSRQIWTRMNAITGNVTKNRKFLVTYQKLTVENLRQVPPNLLKINGRKLAILYDITYNGIRTASDLTGISKTSGGGGGVLKSKYFSISWSKSHPYNPVSYHKN